jgi:hypothetical protein|uniref:Uncharacterized protein n=1 Tax=viral metagenome TaxID=1070528 RepID=A0A6C0IXF3_9ZZZZ
MTSLYTLPPAGARFVGSNRHAVNSLNTSFARSSNITADDVITDSLQNRFGGTIVDGEYVLFEDAVSETESVPAGKGRIWVRQDSDVKKLVFSSDSAGDVELTPGLGDMLAAGNDANGQEFVNVDSLKFHGAIIMGNNVTASSNNSIAVGYESSTSAMYSMVIGSYNECNNEYGLVVGTSCTLNAATKGGVVIGSSIVSSGPAICIGRNIQNAAQDAIIIGYGFTDVSDGGNIIAIGHGSNNLKSAMSYSIAIGSQDNDTISEPLIDVTTHSYNISIGFNSFCFGSHNVAVGTTSKAGGDGNVLIGYGAAAVKSPLALPGVDYSICMGHEASTNSSFSICIGANLTEKNCARAVRISNYGSYSLLPHEDSVSIGYDTHCKSNFSVCLGSHVINRVQDEFCTRFTRSVRGSITTINSVSTTLVSFQTATNDVLHVEATINGVRNDHLVTYMAVYENYHFRNKAGVLSMSSLVGTKTEDTSDGSAGFTSLIQAAAGLIELKVTGRSDETIQWVGVLRIYGAPSN